MLDHCFKSNAGIGGWMSDQTGEATDFHEFTFKRFVFDTIFNLIILVVLVNIVSGIIIDKFGELREKDK